MDKLRLCLTWGGLFWVALSSSGQERKPGLYEVTITTTMVSPAPSRAPSPRTMQACLTPEMIDKYGAIVPDNLVPACQLANVVRKPGGMSAEIVCFKGLTGHGKLEVNWTDSEHSKGSIVFSGTIQPGDTPIKIEWNAVTSSTYKGPDCGATKAPATPANPATH